MNYYLAIDIGGTFIKYGLLDNDGNVVEKGKIPTNQTDKEVIMNGLHEAYMMYKDRGIKGIAMSVPGLIDVEHGIMITSGACTALMGCHMSEELSALCDGIPVSVENDGKAAALAEAWKGAAKDVPNCCVLGFGTGIAGATIINKKALRGNHLIAGEMSAFPIPTSYKEVKPVQMAFKYSTITVCTRASEAIGEEVDGIKLMKLYKEGNEAIVDIMEDWFYNIAILCHQLALTVDPDVICIGGGISADPAFTAGIQKWVHEIYTNGGYWFLEPKVATCQFSNDSNMIGALYNFKQLYEGE